MLGAVDSIRPSPAGPGREQIEDALQRILDSADFISSDRKTQFLRYIVEETLSGRASRLKGYDIALAVFERDESFDAQSDPLVRVEAGRLRHSLEHYYLTSGQLDPIRITIPKGRYVPAFSFADGPATAPVQPPEPDPEIEARRNARARSERRWRAVAWLSACVGFALAVLSTVYPLRSHDPRPPRPSAIALPGPSLLVQRFANLGSDAADEHLSSAILEELAGALARFKTMRVFSVADRESMSGSASAHAAQPRSYDYVVRGSIRRQNGTLRVAVYLENGQTGHRLWTEVIESAAPATQSLAVQKSIAGSIATTLGNPYDVLFTQEAKRPPAPGQARSDAYDCAMRFYAYWESLQRSEHGALRDCHEDASRTMPLYTDIWVNLALLYVDEHRFGYNPCECGPPLRRATEAARRAIALEPDNARAHMAMAVVHWFRLDFHAFNEEAEQALALNENDRLIAAELGLRLTLRSEWSRALPLLDQSVGRAPFKPRLYRLAYALHAFEMDDDVLALDELRRMEQADHHPLSCLIYAAIYARSGRDAEALGAWRSFAEKVPAAAADVRAWMLSRGMSDQLTARIMRALEKTLAAGA